MATERSPDSCFVSDPVKITNAATPSTSVGGSLGPGFDSKDGRLNSSTSIVDYSSYSVSTPSEPSNVLQGPNGTLTPRTSILRNPSKKKTFVDAWRSVDGSGPAVLQIPAIPTARNREVERERERMAREKEIERELKEKEQAEKVWGIPKKAFYMGLGEINFNAQMAILGGWGNGSGPATDFRPNMIVPLNRRPSNRSSKGGRRKTGRINSISKEEREQQREREKQQAIEREQAVRKQREKEEGENSDSSMDLEELASLNAIINTRRSMEAAQALANGQHKMPTLRKSLSHVSLRASSTARPSLSIQREASIETTPSYAPSSSDRPSHRAKLDDYEEKPPISRASSSECFPQQSRIRFAPLPYAHGGALSNNANASSNDVDEMTADAGLQRRVSTDAFEPEKTREEVSARQEVASEASDEDEMEEGDENRGWGLSGLGGSNGKWYLMGMPKSVFKSQNAYRYLRRPSSTAGIDSSVQGEVGASPSQERPMSAALQANERRGRRTSRIKKSSSRASSIKSRSSSVGSNDAEDERKRRRQMIRASRPGGTGMVTLPDGTKIRARRVGEEDSDDDEFIEWGFAGLAKEVRRKSIGEKAAERTATTGEKRASDDEGGRGEGEEGEEAGGEVDGLAWVKRRRKEREESSKALQEADKDMHAEAEAREKASKQSLPTIKKAVDVDDNSPNRSSTMLLSKPRSNASHAAEVRRRHEEEVAALGKEVLENISKAKKSKLQMQRSATLDVGTAAVSAAEKGSVPLPSSAHASQQDRTKASERPSRTLSLDEVPGKVSLMRQPGLAKVRATGSRRSSNSLKSDLPGGGALVMSSPAHTADPSESDEAITSTGAVTPTKKKLHQPTPLLSISPGALTAEPEEVEDNEKDPQRPSIAVAVPIKIFGTSESDLTKVRRGANTRNENDTALSPPSPSSPSSPLQGRTTALRPLSRSPVKESLSTSSSSFGGFYHNVAYQGHGVSIPLPSPDLPRKPDARGYAVVPLPIHQLGRRPARPREGRVWQFDDDDDDDEEEEDDDGEQSESSSEADDEEEEEEGEEEGVERKELVEGQGGLSGSRSASQRKQDDDDDEEEAGMNAEELAEEERRTAMQKKRATTRAAGAELVSTLAKSKQANQATAANRQQSTPDFKGKVHQNSKAATALPPKEAHGRSVIASSSPEKSAKSPRRSMSASVLPLHHRRRPKKDAWNDFDDVDVDDADDLDLWPPTLSTTQLSTTLSTTESNQSVESNSLGRSRSAGRSKRETLALAAHSAKATILREKKSQEAKEKERVRKKKLREEHDLDYGWPRSLQGSSLYN
ncbi:hypothetical protein CBS101457_004135 [Exobasidium rhododendri]|nr:hypothetical protein CBS101457_004135 [Exobasidium rhododendri]